MEFQRIFKNMCMDYSGYVSPTAMMREVSDCISEDTDNDGVGFARMIRELGATWMMGQIVLEFFAPGQLEQAVEIVTKPHSQLGVAVMRQAELRIGGNLIMRMTAKTLPVYFERRKVVPPEAMAYLWETPAGEPPENFGWVEPPATMKEVERYPVKYCDCDTNGHLTAFRYLDLVLEHSGYWSGALHMVRRLQLDFRKECLPGESIRLLHGEENGIQYISGLHEDGTPAFHASVEMDAKVWPRVTDKLHLQQPITK